MFQEICFKKYAFEWHSTRPDSGRTSDDITEFVHN